ncbi:MAG: YbhB/YbcL family Raf kinase inhibitor-like protein [Bdellovibrionales bacterium]|nr:YbhB/YbcL family Raf kinase inhibitor-like protein [Bdellovibrionales bacterium]
MLNTPFQLTTDAIQTETQRFDVRYTCDSDNSSPEIRWQSPPDETEAFALIMDDPDAPQGTFFHWVVYSIPPQVRHLPAGIPPQEVLPHGIRQGLNTARKLGYFGPCPPPDDPPHRYRITLYALKGHIELPGKMSGEELRRRIQEHVIAQTQAVGLYARQHRRAG